jgi:hypothetical protein
MMKRIFRNRKGDTGSGAASLVLLIALIVIVYVLAVDPEVRQEILSDPTDSVVEGSRVSVSEGLLLDTQPGNLATLKSNTITRNINGIRIEAKKRNIVPLKDRSVFASAGIFSEDPFQLKFPLDFPENSDLSLSFNARKREGRLVITLNDNVVFNDEMKGTTPNPINLPREQLRENNVLEFRVSGPGFAFWRANRYLLEGVSVAGSFVDETELEGSRSFLVLNGNELLNTEKLTLEYSVVCLSETDQGRLIVKVNENILSDTVPLCGDRVRQDFLPDKLNTGDNKLTFIATSGKYVIEPLKIIFNFKESANTEYVFELSEEAFNNINGTDKTVELLVEFAGDSHKSLTINVNGNPIHIDQAGKSVSENIQAHLRKGKNYVNLEPRSSDITLLSLKVLTK